MHVERSLFRDRNFLIYFAGVTLSEVGARGTFSVNLYHIFLLTDSTVFVGFVGLFRFVAVVVLGPLGGAVADRVDRVRLVQVTQGLSLLASAGLAVVTFLGVVVPWHIYLAVLFNSAASTFDGPARRALIPGIVKRSQLVRAFALVTPGRELSFMIGPALGGLLVAVGDPALMYAVDAATFLILIAALAALQMAPVAAPTLRPRLLSSIREGFSYVRGRPIIGQLLGMDLLATMFGAYLVVLPALAEDVLEVGPAGYGLLSAAVPAGALLGSLFIYRMIHRLHGGKVVLWAVAGYGLACLALAHSPGLGGALFAALAIGATDAFGSTVRQAAIQVETPDELRGRVSSIQQMATRGGPSLGTLNIGAAAGLLGPVGALTAGALVPIIAAALVATSSARLRTYRVPTGRGDD